MYTGGGIPTPRRTSLGRNRLGAQKQQSTTTTTTTPKSSIDNQSTFQNGSIPRSNSTSFSTAGLPASQSRQSLAEQQQLNAPIQTSSTIPNTTATATTTTATTTSTKESRQNLKPIELAERYIDDFLERDARYPDLDRNIQQAQSSEYAIAPGGPSSPWAPFVRTQIVNIPDIIFEQYNQTECYTRMGLLVDIQRAWITVDNRLYLWDYSSGEQFHSFEELEHTILTVNLVKPKKGTFVEKVNYLLVLTTPLDLYIVAVSYKDNSLELFATGMEVSIKGIDVSCITGSDSSGRIFLSAGNTPDIWEIEYSNLESWFRGKCSKVCHTRSGLSTYAPQFSGLTSTLTNFPGASTASYLLSHVIHRQKSNGWVETLVIDDARHLLYALSADSTIRTFGIVSNNQLKPLITYTYTAAWAHVQMINAASPLLDPKTTSIVAIHTVPPAESSQIHLVAITSTGCRLYLRAARTSAFGFNTNTNQPPTTMQVIQVRFPPIQPALQQTNVGALTSRGGVSAAKPSNSIIYPLKMGKIFSPGYFFGVKASEMGDSIFVTAIDSGRILHQFFSSMVPQFVEIASWVEIEGFVQAIELMTPPLRAADRPEGYGNEVAAQYTCTSPQIVVLTNSGAHIYTRKFPVDTFASLGQDIRPFFDLYGRTETCATALSISCQPMQDASERELAQNVYIELGGKAHLRDDTFNLGPVQPSIDNVRLSGRMEGLATYIARLVRLIWNRPIFKVSKIIQTSQVGFEVVLSVNEIAVIHNALLDLYDFLDRNKSFIDGLSGGLDRVVGSLSRNEELALQAENRSLNALVKLLLSMHECLAFVSMLSEDNKNLGQIVSLLSPEIRERVAKLTYSQLFTRPEGTELAKELVTAVVNRSIAAGASVDSISEVLREKCGSFCSPNDVIIFKAVENLRKAKAAAQTDPELKIQHLQESVRLFEKTAGAIQFDNLRDAVNEFCDLDFYPGAVEVALSAARECDRGNIAREFFFSIVEQRRQQQLLGSGDESTNAVIIASGNESAREIFEKRIKIYHLVFSILEKVDEKVSKKEQESDVTANEISSITRLRDEAYMMAYSSNDELFHYSFYDWFVSKGLAERLLDVQTPYVESYLEQNSRSNLNLAELLWVFYSKRENHYAAAQVTYRLAQSDFDLALSQRIEYLSRARGFSNCYCPPGLRQNMAALGQAVQEEMDVANIQDEILQVVKNDDGLNIVLEQGPTSGQAITRQRAMIDELNGKVMTITDLFNRYADPLGYWEICLAIFQVSDFRRNDEIMRCWERLIESCHNRGIAAGRQSVAESEGRTSGRDGIIYETGESLAAASSTKDDGAYAYQFVATMIQNLGRRFRLYEFVFPVDQLVPIVERYNYQEFGLHQQQQQQGSWVVDSFIEAGVSPEIIYKILVDMFERRDHPFDEPNGLKYLAHDILSSLERVPPSGFDSGLTKSMSMNFNYKGGDGGGGTIASSMSMSRLNPNRFRSSISRRRDSFNSSTNSTSTSGTSSSSPIVDKSLLRKLEKYVGPEGLGKFRQFAY